MVVKLLNNIYITVKQFLHRIRLFTDLNIKPIITAYSFDLGQM